jgi:hypothetical protein
MKTLLAICIAALGLSAASLEPMKVTLATPMIVGGVEMPPGECTIQALANNTDMVALTVRSKSGQQSSILVNRVSTAAPASHSGIVMSFQGGRYVLDQIWLNDSEGFQVLRSGE